MFWLSYECFSILCDAFLLKRVISSHKSHNSCGCMLDKTMSGEPTALKVINKINSKLKFLYRKNRFLSPELQRMLCNAFIQPHFDYACPAWYPNLTEKTKKINA